MKKLLVPLLFLTSFLYGNASDDALNSLMEGNRRFATGVPRLKEVQSQTLKHVHAPFAVVLGCADARTSPEIVFDQNLGDLFVVRVAGNVAAETQQESIEYAANQLHAPLIFVLGHQNCGAVKAVLQGGLLDDDLATIAPLIQPAVDNTKNQSGDRLKNAIIENVRVTIATLRKNKILMQLIEDQKLKIVGGYFDFATGNVELLKS